MRANLIFNPNSGSISQIGVNPEALVSALEAAGFEPVYEATSREEDLDPLLKDVEGLLVVVGGDGTVRAAATRVLGRDIPLAIIPAGTSNNIAATLGIKSQAPLEIIAGLAEPLKRPFDVGSVRSPWGQDYFLEFFGYGLYADSLFYYEPEKGKSLTRSISALVQILRNRRPYPCQVSLDGQDISDDYLLFEVINTRWTGPSVKLAPDASPGDGLFEVLRICEANRDGLLDYISGLLTEDLEELPSVEVSRGRHLEIRCDAGFPFHVDAEVRPQTREQAAAQEEAEGAHQEYPRTEGPVIVDVLPSALEIWLPRPPEARIPVETEEALLGLFGSQALPQSSS